MGTKAEAAARIRLMLVDDHPVVREGLRTLLGEEPDLEFAPVEDLTPRELSILERIGRGWNNRAIAQGLGLTHGTVKGHVSRILEKLGVEDRTQAALLAVREGVVPSSEASRP